MFESDEDFKKLPFQSISMNALLLALFSAVMLSIVTLLLKRDLQHETNTQTVSIYAVVAAAVMLPFISYDFAFLFTATGWLILLKTGAVALSVFCHTLALQHLPVSIYAPLRNISPIFLLFTGALLLGEYVNAVQVLGLVIIITSAVLLDVDIRKKHIMNQVRRFVKNPAVLLLILSAISISFAPLLDRIILRSILPTDALFWYFAILAVMFWAVHIAKERRLPFTGLSRAEWGWLALTGVMVAITDIAIVTAIALPGTALVVLIGVRRLSNLFATLLGGRLFHEGNILYKGILCLCMIFGTVLLVL